MYLAVASATTFWTVAYNLALAQSKCYVSGKEVPCADAIRSLKTAAGLGIGLIVVILLVMLAALVFWIMMLSHAIRHPIPSKAVWILLLLLTGVIGAVVYYFAVKRKINKKTPIAAPAGPV